jgi:hypothetical protein
VPSFIGHPCDLTLRPTQQVSLHAHTPLFPSQSARPWAAAPSQLLSMELTLACNASQICRWHTVHTVSGACDGPYCNAQHPHLVARCRVSMCWLLAAGGWRASRRSWRHKMFSGQWRFGDSISEGQKRLWSRAVGERKFEPSMGFAMLAHVRSVDLTYNHV